MSNTLPIHHFLDQIETTLGKNNHLVLQAEPGAGKSTVVPLHLLNSPWLCGQKIIMLEPRRVAAKSIAHFLASQLGEVVGERIGYQVKNDRKIGANTQLEIVTEGILTRRLQKDPELSGVGLIIFDEFHERTLQADLGLMLAHEIQEALRDDLKLLVMSATIDSEHIASYLGTDNIIQCPGRTFPVSVSYKSKPKATITDQVIAALADIFSRQENGSDDSNAKDILVFLPGQREIMRSIEAALSRWEDDKSRAFLPLHGRLSLEQQEQAIRYQPTQQRIIFSTNIAETSLTIEGVGWVIDSGLEKRLEYDPSSGMTRLVMGMISKASAEQRKGRAGRLQAGHCIRLWSETQQTSLIDYQPEEIANTELSSLVLELSGWGHNDYDNTPWLSQPPQAHYHSAQQLLCSLGLVDAKYHITTRGHKVLTMGIHPRLGAMLLEAREKDQRLACELAGLLGEQDILSNTGVDISERLIALQDYKQDAKATTKRYGLRRHSLQQVLQSAKSLAQLLNAESSPKTAVNLEALPRLLLKAYPDRLAKRRANSERYLMANGKGVVLPNDDALVGSEWLIIHDCDGQKRDGRIYSACAIDQAQLMSLLADKIETRERYQLDSKKQRIIGRRLASYQAITLSETPTGEVGAEDFLSCLKSLIPSEGLSLLHWDERCDSWLERVQWLAGYDTSLPSLSHPLLLETIDIWLLPYISHITSLSQLKSYPIYDLLIANLSWDQQQQLEVEAPTHYQSPTGQQVPIVYDKQQGPIVSIILQSMFGETSSPLLAFNQVPLRFELLSPARRPIQTTSDLNHFWRTSYFEVAKEMRAKYPKHRWPEEPLLATPGHSRKPKPPR